MKLKKLTDQELVSQIQKLNREVLIELFERSYVDAKNRFDQKEIAERECQDCLAIACTFIWQHFQERSLEKGQKVGNVLLAISEFIANSRAGQEIFENPLKSIKKPNIVEDFRNEFQNIDKPIETNFHVLKEKRKTALGLYYFEKWSIHKIAEHQNSASDKALDFLMTSFKKWVQLLVQNIKYRIDLDLFSENLHSFEAYRSGKFSEEQALQWELKLSESANLTKTQEKYFELIAILRSIQRRVLSRFIIKNATTRLMGNIWGKKWSIVSAIFIALTGILIWYSKNNPSNSKENEPPKKELIEKSESDSLENTE